MRRLLQQNTKRIEYAKRQALKRKGLDIIIANLMVSLDIGFNQDENQVTRDYLRIKSGSQLKPLRAN